MCAVLENVLSGSQIHVKLGSTISGGGDGVVDLFAAFGLVQHIGDHFQHGAFVAVVTVDERYWLVIWIRAETSVSK